MSEAHTEGVTDDEWGRQRVRLGEMVIGWNTDEHWDWWLLRQAVGEIDDKWDFNHFDLHRFILSTKLYALLLDFISVQYLIFFIWYQTLYERKWNEKKTPQYKYDKTLLVDELDSLIRLIWELSRSCLVFWWVHWQPTFQNSQPAVARKQVHSQVMENWNCSALDVHTYWGWLWESNRSSTATWHIHGLWLQDFCFW